MRCTKPTPSSQVSLLARGAAYDLWVACGVGDVEGAKQFIDACGDKTQLCKSSEPFWGDYDNPLVVACFQGHTEIVRALIDAGADPDSPFEIDVAGEHGKTVGTSTLACGESWAL